MKCRLIWDENNGVEFFPQNIHLEEFDNSNDLFKRLLEIGDYDMAEGERLLEEVDYDIEEAIRSALDAYADKYDNSPNIIFCSIDNSALCSYLEDCDGFTCSLKDVVRELGAFRGEEIEEGLEELISDDLDYLEGKTLKHPRFGTLTIVEATLTDDGEGLVIKVTTEEGNEKTLVINSNTKTLYSTKDKEVKNILDSIAEPETLGYDISREEIKDFYASWSDEDCIKDFAKVRYDRNKADDVFYSYARKRLGDLNTKISNKEYEAYIAALDSFKNTYGKSKDRKFVLQIFKDEYDKLVEGGKRQLRAEQKVEDIKGTIESTYPGNEEDLKELIDWMKENLVSITITSPEAYKDGVIALVREASGVIPEVKKATGEFPGYIAHFKDGSEKTVPEKIYGWFVDKQINLKERRLRPAYDPKTGDIASKEVVIDMMATYGFKPGHQKKTEELE